MEFNPKIPIYLQIIEDVKKMICIGKYQDGEKISSVRELALYYGVNPNTVQKALSELEKEGLLKSVSTSGRFLNINQESILRLRKEMMDASFDQLMQLASEMRMSEKEFTEYLEGKKHDYHSKFK